MRRRSRHLKHRYRVVVAAVLAAVGLALLFAYRRGMARLAVSPRLVPPRYLMLQVTTGPEWAMPATENSCLPVVQQRMVDPGLIQSRVYHCTRLTKVGPISI